MFIATCGVTPRSRQSATNSRRVVALVCRHRAPLARVVAIQKLYRRFALCIAVRLRHLHVHRRPCGDPSACVPCNTASRLGSSLAKQLRLRVLRRYVRLVAALLPVPVHVGLRPGPGGSSFPSRRRMLFTAAQDSINVPSTLKCSFESRCACAPCARSGATACAPPSPRSAGPGSW